MIKLLLTASNQRGDGGDRVLPAILASRRQVSRFGASLAGMPGIRVPPGASPQPAGTQPKVGVQPPCGELAGSADPIGEIGAALHSLTRSLKQGRLHHFPLTQAPVDADQAAP